MVTGRTWIRIYIIWLRPYKKSEKSGLTQLKIPNIRHWLRPNPTFFFNPFFCKTINFYNIIIKSLLFFAIIIWKSFIIQIILTLLLFLTIISSIDKTIASKSELYILYIHNTLILTKKGLIALKSDSDVRLFMGSDSNLSPTRSQTF